MADRIGYLPMDFASSLPFKFKHLDPDDLDRFTALLTDAYGRGYHDGYVRGITDEGGRAYLKEQRQKDAPGLPPASSQVEKKEGETE